MMAACRRWWIVGPVAVTLAMLGVEPSGAGSRPAESRWIARCWSIGVTTISGGLRLVENSRVTAVGHSVPHCVGRIRGHEVTGPGELNSTERIEGSCRGGRGVADIRIRIPTSGGIQEVQAVVPFSFTGTFGVGESTVLSENLIVVLAALEGDCITQPVTKLRYWDTFAINTSS
jgi:hypothetical protein